MNKREFIKSTGFLSLASMIPFKGTFGATKKAAGACVLIPTETAGPFPLDLTENTNFFRKNIKEEKTGVPLTVKLKIIGEDNCEPMPNVRVNIWHCDKDGLYSGYSQTNNPGQAGLTYLRGYQFTDSAGEASFETIFPGWYTGRICHIHFQVYVNAAYSAISQLTFDIPAKNAIYSANTALYTKGTDPMALSSDNIFSDGYTYQIATLTPNTATGGYDAYLEVTIKGAGVTGLSNLEKETLKQVSLGQNYPNPYTTETAVPFTLVQSGIVKISLYNLEGKLVFEKDMGLLNQGTHELKLNFAQLGLPISNYAYQLEIKNDHGLFRTAKMMTAGK